MDTPIVIQWLESSESDRILHVHLNQMATHDTQLIDLKKQARHFRHFLAAAAHKNLDRLDA
jgi:hypothetical protein